MLPSPQLGYGHNHPGLVFTFHKNLNFIQYQPRIKHGDFQLMFSRFWNGYFGRFNVGCPKYIYTPLFVHPSLCI